MSGSSASPMRKVLCAVAVAVDIATSPAMAARRKNCMMLSLFIILNPTNTARRTHVRSSREGRDQSFERGRAVALPGYRCGGRQLAPAVAGGRMQALGHQRGALDPAAVDHIRTAQVQVAAGRRV